MFFSHIYNIYMCRFLHFEFDAKIEINWAACKSFLTNLPELP